MHFVRWLEILKGVPNSVLWVSKVKGAPEQMDMLRSQAVQRGVSADRLVFADRLPTRPTITPAISISGCFSTP